MHSPVHKVLLVEDVPLIATITLQMLKKAPTHPYVPVHTTCLADTLATLQREDFDVILLDLNLPDSRDLDTLSRVIEVAPESPIIVLTASNGDEAGLRALQLGAQDFLLKGDFNYLTLDRAILYAMERHRLQRTIRQLAVLDELTGLYNRRGFNALSLDLLQRVRSSALRGYLCFFDLDRFKQINDGLGHARGDEVLKEFAATLRGVFRKDALLVRLGGDEFVAMGLEHQPGQTEEALGALQAVLAARNQPGAAYDLASSAGLAHFDHTGPATIEEITAAADAALYRDKEERRRRRVASPLAPRGEKVGA